MACSAKLCKLQNVLVVEKCFILHRWSIFTPGWHKNNIPATIAQEIHEPNWSYSVPYPAEWPDTCLHEAYSYTAQLRAVKAR